MSVYDFKSPFSGDFSYFLTYILLYCKGKGKFDCLLSGIFFCFVIKYN